jgi:hypothetical protein
MLFHVLFENAIFISLKAVTDRKSDEDEKGQRSLTHFVVAFQASLVHFVVVFQASLVHVVVAFQEISCISLDKIG